MTVMDERTSHAAHTSQMQVEEFEQIASKAPETVMLEFIDGRIGVKRMPDGDHDTITMWLLMQCMQSRPGMTLHLERGLRVGAGEVPTSALVGIPKQLTVRPPE